MDEDKLRHRRTDDSQPSDLSAWVASTECHSCCATEQAALQAFLQKDEFPKGRQMNRRQFLAGAASLGMAGVWATPLAASPSRLAWREERASFPQGGRSRAGRGVPARHRQSASDGAGNGRLDVSRFGRRAHPCNRVLVPLYGRDRRREPSGAHDHGSSTRGPASRALRPRLVQ